MASKRRDVVSWLLDGDPSIRWQVMRDLTQEPGEVVAAERSRVAEEGWGARLLARQTADGHWSDEPQHGWMTTTDALRLSRDLGADPAGRRKSATRSIASRNRVTWWQLDGRPFFDGETEPCINGRVLATGAYFGDAGERLVERLLGEQLEDGGWNCEAPPSTRSSFHTTICVLEGLLEYEKAQRRHGRGDGRAGAGQQYLLERRMFRSLSTGEVIDRRWTRFSFPAVWHYDVLRGLDYLRSAGVEPDERVAEAVALVGSGGIRTGDGRSMIPTAIRRSTSRWRPGSASRAAGIRCARCACSTGTANRSRGRPRTQKLVSNSSVAKGAGAAAEARSAAADELVAGNQRQIERHALHQLEGVLGVSAEPLRIIAGVAVDRGVGPDEELVDETRADAQLGIVGVEGGRVFAGEARLDRLFGVGVEVDVPLDFDARRGAVHLVGGIVRRELRLLKVDAGIAAERDVAAHELIAGHNVELPEFAVDGAGDRGGGILKDGEAAIGAQEETAFCDVAVHRSDGGGVPVERPRRDVEAGVDLVGLRFVGGARGIRAGKKREPHQAAVMPRPSPARVLCRSRSGPSHMGRIGGQIRRCRSNLSSSRRL